MMPVKSQAFCRMGGLCCLLLVSSCAHQANTAPPPPLAKPETVQISTRTNNWKEDWTPLFDGKTLTNWAVTDFGGHGVVDVAAGQINIGMGADLSGITWTNGTLPKTDYEISLQAIKVDGSDFFCGLTFSVADSSCSLIVGGWGGGVVGLSSLDDYDASENETTHAMQFNTGQWYQVRLRVTSAKIEAWIDKEKIINISIVGRKVSLRPGSIYLSAPLGVATYETSAGIRDFKLRLIEH
jgi:hypothetical protein